MDPARRTPRAKSRPAPLNAQRLEELALAYVARFATSAARLRDYCHRKLRERGWEGAEVGAEPPEVAALVARFVALGYVDDLGFARMRSGALLRRGYGERRVEQALRGAGIGEDERAAVRTGPRAARAAAVAFARRRRLGPFAAVVTTDPGERARQCNAMLRAGHTLDNARALLNAGTEAEAAAWADACEDENDLA